MDRWDQYSLKSSDAVRFVGQAIRDPSLWKTDPKPVVKWLQKLYS
jgi:hypothetical protein